MDKMNKDRENRFQDSVHKDLSDVQRVKVLSPGMLVIRRFVRNRLAIVGFAIILFMFLFSFLGGLLTPYDETQVFKYVGTMSKEYASITLNTDYRYTVAEGASYNDAVHARFILAKNGGQTLFNHNDKEYHIIEEATDFYRIVMSDPVARVTSIRGIQTLSPIDGFLLPEGVENEIKTAIEQSIEHFIFDGQLFTLSQSGREFMLGVAKDVAIESILIMDGISSSKDLGFNFKYTVEKHIKNSNDTQFEFEGETYQIEEEDNIISIYKLKSDGKEQYALVSQLAIQPVSQDVFLSIGFKTAIEKAIADGEASLIYPDESGQDIEYTINRINNVYTVRTETQTHLIAMHEKPSKTHWLGTDKHGMDVLTRLMYGGRISLSIGFIVVVLETIIGVVMGGLAGYFGSWVDMLIMRIVDLFNCIPFLPLLIILGAVMDSLDVDPQIRIYYLMLILGLMSWPGIARMVRGQILSLREQEFMLAAEATGLRVSRRIFKHLVPNVIPQLIVLATLGLGGIILYESTLSFLGLGVKFPFASWGNIISGVSTAYEMTNFWFVWIPAGMLILLTVLGFNFVGDGLRDAFDPKMKR